MTRTCGSLLVVTILLAAAGARADAPAPEPDVRAIFGEPTALLDRDDKPLVTRRGAAHPVIYDYDGDGINDLVLGCKATMFTTVGEALFVRNVGTNAKPRFDWAGRKPLKLEGAQAAFNIGCGCNTGGTFELHPLDANADGHMDLVVNTRSSTRHDAFLLLNSARSRQEPTFVRKQVVANVTSHGIGSGGGDWNADGIPDYAHQVNSGGWTVLLGIREGGGDRFTAKPILRSDEYTIVGHEEYPKADGRPHWFDNMVYAGNFSGRHPAAAARTIRTHECPLCRHMIQMSAGSDVVELVASMDDPKVPGRSHLNYYWLDHRAKTCTFKGRIAAVDANYVRLSVADLNGDGCLDVIYAGGVGGNGDNTTVWMIPGKVKSILPPPPRPLANTAIAPATAPAGDLPPDPKADPKALFTAPQPLLDQDGKEIVTRRASGHPLLIDFSGDGLCDLILGCYRDMAGGQSEILLLRNVGTKDRPRFTWPAQRTIRAVDMPPTTQPYELAVDHRGSATLELHAADDGGDGLFDLLVNSGKHRGLDVFLLRNTGKPGDPNFGVWSRFQNIDKGEPQCSGGGDWNGDGVADYIHNVNFQGWQVHLGKAGRPGGPTGAPVFSQQAGISSSAYRMIGQDRWFDRTPYAIVLGGRPAGNPDNSAAKLTLSTRCGYCEGAMEAPVERSGIDILASMDTTEKASTQPRGSTINLYRLDHAQRTCRLIGPVVQTDVAAVRLGPGDLNADGATDIVYTGGLSATGDETKIWVLFGQAAPGKP